ncbi:MAG: class I SAM-dependent methyltransferase [Planctomycetota bacterium]
MTHESTLPDELARLTDELSSEDETRAIQQGYLRYFRPGERVLDVGCGRGTFLDLLREAGIEGVGADSSAAAVSACRARGHEVLEVDAFEVPERWASEGELFDGLVVSHLVEHLQPDRALLLLRCLSRVLRPGGRLLMVTPNPRSLIVLSEVFWLDPTHVRPYPRQLLERLGTKAGFRVRESYDDPASVPRRRPLRRWVARLRSFLSGADRSGPMDSIVLFEWP